MAINPQHGEIIYGEYLPETQISYANFFNRYAGSEFGIHHADQPLRYSARYGYDKKQMLKDLGDSVHPVLHMVHLANNTTIPFIAEQNTSGEEQFTELEVVAEKMAALSHDEGECEHMEIIKQLGYSVGDIPWNLKTVDDGRREHIIRQLIYSEIYPDIPKELLEAADDIIDHKGGTFPREAFQMIERIDYYQTGLRAGEVALRLYESKLGMDELRLTQLGCLAVEVTNNHRQELHDSSNRFPYAKIVLDSGKRLDERIHRIFAASSQ